MPPISALASGNSLQLGFDAAWLADNPLTVADLEREQELLQQVGYDLKIA
jgi:hypothetical protein